MTLLGERAKNIIIFMSGGGGSRWSSKKFYNNLIEGLKGKLWIKLKLKSNNVEEKQWEKHLHNHVNRRADNRNLHNITRHKTKKNYILGNLSRRKEKISCSCTKVWDGRQRVKQKETNPKLCLIVKVTGNFKLYFKNWWLYSEKEEKASSYSRQA